MTRLVIVGNVVDAAPAMRDREQGCLCRRIDVEAGLAIGRPVPGARPVKQAIAEHDAFDAGRRQDLMLHVGHALHRNLPGRIGEV